MPKTFNVTADGGNFDEIKNVPFILDYVGQRSRRKGYINSRAVDELTLYHAVFDRLGSGRERSTAEAAVQDLLEAHNYFDIEIVEAG